MKTWANPVVEELVIAETANGGEVSMNFDNQWFDAKGALHVNFVSYS